MNQCGYAQIKESAERMKMMLQSSQRSKNIDELIKIVQTKRTLTSLCEMFFQLKSHEPKIDEIIHLPSSGYSSDCYDEEGALSRIENLSYMEAKNLLIDSDVIQTAEQKEEFEHVKEHYLFIKDIKEQSDCRTFKAFLESLSKCPSFDYVKFVFIESMYCVILRFDRYDNSSKLFINSLKEKPINFQMYFGEIYTVEWIQLEPIVSKDGRKKRKPKLYNNPFYGVIMRNLPAQTNPTQIVGYLFRNGIQSKIDQICFKKGDYFTLAHFESLEDAEKACLFMNGKKIVSNVLKVHLHPKTTKSKICLEQSPFRTYFIKTDLDFELERKEFEKLNPPKKTYPPRGSQDRKSSKDKWRDKEREKERRKEKSPKKESAALKAKVEEGEIISTNTKKEKERKENKSRKRSFESSKEDRTSKKHSRRRLRSRSRSRSLTSPDRKKKYKKYSSQRYSNKYRVSYKKSSRDRNSRDREKDDRPYYQKERAIHKEANKKFDPIPHEIHDEITFSPKKKTPKNGRASNSNSQPVSSPNNKTDPLIVMNMKIKKRREDPDLAQ